jgi:hypothetical protein
MQKPHIYARAVLQGTLALLAIPVVIVLLGVLGAPPAASWIIPALVLCAAFVAVLAPISVLVLHIRDLYREGILPDVIFVAGGVAYWTLMAAIGRFGPFADQPATWLLLVAGFIGLAWIHVAGTVVTLNIVAFWVTVGRRLSLGRRLMWYAAPFVGTALTVILRDWGIWTPNERANAIVASGIILAAVGYLTFKGPSSRPSVGRDSRYDPLARILARILSGKRIGQPQ